MQGNEPFDDVGTDGVADAGEPGYDPVANPDPNGDDYHYLWNPTGTENNWRYDEGEPYAGRRRRRRSHVGRRLPGDEWRAELL